jgi:hydrogenase maturation protease
VHGVGAELGESTVSRTLIAGVGNIFMGDDAFGCEVAQRLGRRKLPAGVDVVDFGIRAMDLRYTLTEGYDFAILIDTVKRGGAPGTLYVIEPDLSGSDGGTDPDEQLIGAHDLDLAGILRCVALLRKRGPRVLLVGCEPEFLGGDYGCIGLTAAVSAAVDKAVAEVQTVLKELPRGRAARGTERQTMAGPECGAATRLREAST